MAEDASRPLFAQSAQLRGSTFELVHPQLLEHNVICQENSSKHNATHATITSTSLTQPRHGQGKLFLRICGCEGLEPGERVRPSAIRVAAAQSGRHAHSQTDNQYAPNDYHTRLRATAAIAVTATASVVALDHAVHQPPPPSPDSLACKQSRHR